MLTYLPVITKKNKKISLCFALLLLLVGCKASKKISESEHRVTKIIQTARSYMGTPYKWGGTSRSGLDCSGLLLISFRSAEIDIPRTSLDQSKMGKEVSLYELKPGDLVFFAAKKHNRRKITHVGLVTDVHGKHNVQFIHASTKLGVVENNIYTDYYRHIFVKARRVF
jgi:cell wall-associated NlpC family hydrolase